MTAVHSKRLWSWRCIGLVVPLLGTACATPPAADEVVAAVAAAPVNDHCAQKAPESPFERSTVEYVVPDVVLTDQTGQPFPLASLTEGDRPVAVNFIFATCTTICPVMTATFSQMRRELGEDADQIRLVSITIDPEHDTPQILAEYGQRFDAPPEWRFLTGPSADIDRVLHGFDAYTSTKFDHKPITVLRAPGASEWIRLDGLGSGAALATQVREMLPSPVQP